jgi:hypothetical protein
MGVRIRFAEFSMEHKVGARGYSDRGIEADPMPSHLRHHERDATLDQVLSSGSPSVRAAREGEG